MTTRMYSIRLNPKHRAILAALTEIANMSQSEAVGSALEHWGDWVLDNYEGQRQDVPVEDREAFEAKVAKLRRSLAIIGK